MIKGRLPWRRVREHFEAKGFKSMAVSGKIRGIARVHTLDLWQGDKIVMSFAVREDSCIALTHIESVVKRYAAGEKVVNPYTGKG
jgi:hypothetical protein